MSGMMQQGKDGRWMDYSSGMGQYKPNYQPPAAAAPKPINPANDPLTDANYLGGSQPWWEQKAAAPKPALNSMQTSGLMRGPMGTYTGNVASQIPGLMSPNASTSAADARGLYNHQMGQINDLRKLGQRDDYAQGGQAHTYALNSAYSRPSGMLQNALQNTQRSAAERGITLGSGLTQGALLSNRNDAAKMAAASAGQVDQDFAVRQAEQQERNRNYLADLTRLESSIGSQSFNDQLAGLRLGMQQDETNYNRRTFDPFKVEGLGLANEYQRNTNAYQPRMLDQQYQAGAQGLTRNQQGIDYTNATQPGQINLANAQSAYGTKDANYSGQYLDEEATYQNSGAGRQARDWRRFNESPTGQMMTQAINAPFKYGEKFAPIAGRFMGMGG